jgi:Membrane protein involved in colicin uptake
MEYAKIVAVTGLPGLYELVSSKSDGAIVRSLEDKSTKFVSSRIHNFSHLESIEVYTVRDNVNLVEIFNAMDSAGEKLPDEKDNAAVKAYFEKVYPDLDFDRVYSSDMKKMVKWFGVLKNNGVEIKLRQPQEEEAAEAAAEAVEAAPAAEEKAPAKAKTAKEPKEAKESKDKEPAKKEAKPAAKKTAAKKEEAGGEKEAPKKKAAPKAKKDDGEKKETPAKKKSASSKEKK